MVKPHRGRNVRNVSFIIIELRILQSYPVAQEHRSTGAQVKATGSKKKGNKAGDGLWIEVNKPRSGPERT